MKKIGLFLLAVVMMVGVAGCSGDDSNDNSLVGTWTTKMSAERSGDPDVTVTLTFNANNTLTSTENGVAGESGTWSVDGNVLTIIQSSSKMTFTYSVNGNTLTLTESGVPGPPLVWTRV